MTGLAAAVRFLHLAAGAQLVGVLAVRLLVARPAFHAASHASAVPDGLDRRLLQISRWRSAS